MGESYDAVEAMMKRVGEVLADAGHETSAYVDRARQTLRAVATDEELRAEFERGQVVTDSEPVGFGAASGALKAPARKPKPEDAAAKRRRKQAATRVERVKAALEKADDAVDGARAKLREAEAERTRLADALDAAEAELD